MKIKNKRTLSQIFFLFIANIGFRINDFFNGKTGFCYPFFYCHSCPTSSSACPIRAVEEGLFRSNFDLSKINWKLLLYPIFIIGIIGTITGRAVCGWACPIGFLQDLTAKPARKLKKFNLFKKYNINKIDPYLRYIKYFVFVGFVIITASVFGFMFTNICPVGFLVGTIPVSIFNPGEYLPTMFFYPALVFFLLFLVLIFTVERGWCKYFCPVGAMFAPFNKISFYQVKVDTKKCKNCNLCSKVCPMGIDIPNMNRDPECILCGRCIEECPQNLIKFERGGK